MKIMTVVGARPQFIKAAAVSRVLREKHREILVHTGQHYDENMSRVFFDELHIPEPDYNLAVGSGTHAHQTAAMLTGIEDLIYECQPDCLLVYGDTNSTLAGALAASKLLLPVVHVEAGLRSYNRAMPEEQNRVLTDHLSTVLFCPTDTAVENLKKENITDGVYQVGDVMCDAVLYYRAQAEAAYGAGGVTLEALDGAPVDLPGAYYLATVHRAENTHDEKNIAEILRAFAALDAPVVFPVHPRSRQMVTEIVKAEGYDNILTVQPVNYLCMLYLTRHAKTVVTDSGGLQKEAYILETPTVTVRDQTEWVETVESGYNRLCPPETRALLAAVGGMKPDQAKHRDYYGDGHAAERITEILGGMK